MGGLLFIIILGWLSVAITVAADARGRGHNYIAWFIVISITGIFGAIIYLINRKEPTDEPYTYSPIAKGGSVALLGVGVLWLALQASLQDGYISTIVALSTFIGISLIAIGWYIYSKLERSASKEKAEQFRQPTSSPLLRVSADVIDAETNETTTISTKIYANNTQHAKKQFKEICIKKNYVLDGEPTIDIISGISSAEDSYSTGTKSSSKLDTGSVKQNRPFHLPILSRLVSSDKSSSKINDENLIYFIDKVLSHFDTLDAKIWNYSIKLSIIVWGAITLLPDGSLPTTLVSLIFWLLMPVSIFLDSKYMTELAEWNPNRKIWTLGAFIPQLNIIVGILYLVRRYYAVQQREFGLSVVLADMKQGYSRLDPGFEK